MILVAEHKLEFIEIQACGRSIVEQISYRPELKNGSDDFRVCGNLVDVGCLLGLDCAVYLQVDVLDHLDFGVGVLECFVVRQGVQHVLVQQNLHAVHRLFVRAADLVEDVVEDDLLARVAHQVVPVVVAGNTITVRAVEVLVESQVHAEGILGGLHFRPGLLQRTQTVDERQRGLHLLFG